MTAIPRVYCVNRTNDDLSAANNFGRLEFINSRYVFADEISDDTFEMPALYRDKLIAAVRRFAPERDYLLIAGDHLQLVTMAALLARAYKRFMVLRYDREAKAYFPVAVDAA